MFHIQVCNLCRVNFYVRLRVRVEVYSVAYGYTVVLVPFVEKTSFSLELLLPLSKIN